MTVKFGCPGKHANNGSFHFFFRFRVQGWIQAGKQDTEQSCNFGNLV